VLGIIIDLETTRMIILLVHKLFSFLWIRS
jgi:hypothetical protein